MKQLFKDDEHRTFYEECLRRAPNDSYHRALFYTLGLTPETRKHINQLYDFRERCIEFEGLNKAWQTGTTLKVCRLAFNLFNGYNGTDESEAGRFTPYYLFCCTLAEYMLEAIRIRYSEYTRG
jgi:hypothetical protein